MSAGITNLITLGIGPSSAISYVILVGLSTNEIVIPTTGAVYITPQTRDKDLQVSTK